MGIAHQSATRNESRFLVRPNYEGKSFPCYESSFDNTCLCPRVVRLEDMRLGTEAHTPQQYFDLKGKQPTFWLQERWGAEGIEWNGLLLFAAQGKEAARQTVRTHRQEWNVVLAFDEPDADRYFFLVATPTDGGTEKDFARWQQETKNRLQKSLKGVKTFRLASYTRAYTAEHYDIVDRDALFGQPEQPKQKETDFRPASETSVFQLLQATIGRLFRKSA